MLANRTDLDSIVYGFWSRWDPDHFQLDSNFGT